MLADNSLLVSGFAPIVVSNTNGTTTVSRLEPVTAVVRYRENGTLETTFGTGGRVQLPGDNVGRGLAVQSDGRIVLAGSIDIATFPATQNPLRAHATARERHDRRFVRQRAAECKRHSPIEATRRSASRCRPTARSSPPGGSNIQVNSNFAVARYDSDGDLDTSFSQDGKLTIDFFGSTDVAENVAIQSNGKIVLGGLARDSIDGYGVARVLP